jgi:hypothetical protein
MIGEMNVATTVDTPPIRLAKTVLSTFLNPHMPNS